ncbi:MAG: DUF3806 domain-containing protein [Pseudomonadota bacterium]
MKILGVCVGLFLLAFPLLSTAAQSGPADESTSGLRELTPEQLENYQFEGQDEGPEPLVEALSIGQQYLLNTQRREAKDLIAQKLGIMSLKGDTRDLRVLQLVYDRRILRADQVREWQAMGVLFGDILTEVYPLEWVSYEDELGASKALRYAKTRNFVFPVTVFSKRLQFNEKIDVQAIYDSISADVEAFIDYEKRLGPK